MCAGDLKGRKRPPALPKRTCGARESSVAAFEGTDIQALLDRCDHVQEQWDPDTHSVSRKTVPRGTASASASKSSSCSTHVNSVATSSRLPETCNAKAESTDDDLVVVDLVTDEGKEWEEALLEMRRALDQVKAVSTEEDESHVTEQIASPPVAASRPPCHAATPERACMIDTQRERFQRKLRELASGSNDNACELTDGDLLEAARKRLLQEEETDVAPINSELGVGGTRKTLRRGSSETQLARTPSLDSAFESCPSTSEQGVISNRPVSGRASVGSLSLASADGHSAAALCGSGHSRPHSTSSRTSSLSIESSTKTSKAEHVAALHQCSRECNSQAPVAKCRQLQGQKKEARRVSVADEVSSGVKDAQRTRQEESSQKGYKWQQRRANQECEDCEPQVSARKEQSQSGGKALGKHPNAEGISGSKTTGTFGSKAICKTPQDQSRSASGVAKLPRLHASRSAPGLLHQSPGSDGANFSLPQVPRTRSWFVQ